MLPDETGVATSPVRDDQNVQDLVHRAQAGDRQAFGSLVCQYRTGVVNVVYRMCGDAALAEDAAQDCFIRAWEHLHRFQFQPGSTHGFRNWLYRIATNCALNLLRQAKTPHIATIDLANVPVPDPHRSPEGRIEAEERAAAVTQAVLALPDASRVALILREYEGLSYKEIAQTLDIPIGTVMSRLNYARSQLRESLASYLEAEG